MKTVISSSGKIIDCRQMKLEGTYYSLTQEQADQLAMEYEKMVNTLFQDECVLDWKFEDRAYKDLTAALQSRKMKSGAYSMEIRGNVRCGDDFTVMYREWQSCYEYPRVKDAVTPLDRARNEIARHNFKKLHEQLLDFVDRRLDVVMAYIGDDFIGGAFVNSTTTHRSLPEVLLNKVTADPNIILRASKEGARLEMRSWQSLLDHTKILEPRQTEV